MKRHTRRRAPLAAALLLVHAACYSYVPLEPGRVGSATATTSSSPAADLGLEGVEQGTHLRIHLSEPGSYPLSHVTPNNVTVIDGDLIRWDESDVYVSAYWMKTAGLQDFRGKGETVSVPLDKIERVDERRLSAGRTAAISAAIAGAVVVLGVTFGSPSGEGGPGGGGPPEQ